MVVISGSIWDPRGPSLSGRTIDLLTLKSDPESVHRIEKFHNTIYDRVSLRVALEGEELRF